MGWSKGSWTDWMTETLHEQFTLQEFQTNGIRVRAAVEGTGPLVILVHGWPELWYSWRHQIKPLAAAGYRVVAPDVRGYGGSDKPHAIEAYDMATIMADVVGLIDALGEEQAILVGHDWGAPIVWNTAALHPTRVRAVADGQREFVSLAIWSSTERPLMPCGACRQALYEFSPELEVIVAGDGVGAKSYTLAELLPGGVRPGDL